MLASTVLLTVLFAAPAGEEQAGDTRFTKNGEEQIFDNVMERRFAFRMNDNRHESLEGNLWPFFVGGFCCFAGPVWFPALVLGDTPKGYFEEAFVTWLFYAVPVAILYAIPYVGWGLSALLFPINLAIAFYMVPVNSINAWDRAAKRGGFRQRQRRRGELLLPEPRRLSALGAESPMAY